jgi:uncharacterized protein YecE (DUF72 family)
MTTTFHIGCAGWSIPKVYSGDFPSEGSHLQRYSGRLNAVEINSSFYRPHRRTTYARWSETVPAEFRFSVKMPRAITHDARLVASGKLLDRFFDEISALEQKLGCILIQLPPSFRFDRGVARRFLKTLRHRFDGSCVVEPRHATWFDGNANELLAEFDVGRVAADPAVVPVAARPGGSEKIIYYRLHGSPKIYYSEYGPDYLKTLVGQLRMAGKNAQGVWCVFDNTALGFATGNALEVAKSLR